MSVRKLKNTVRVAQPTPLNPDVLPKTLPVPDVQAQYIEEAVEETLDLDAADDSKQKPKKRVRTNRGTVSRCSL